MNFQLCLVNVFVLVNLYATIFVTCETSDEEKIDEEECKEFFKKYIESSMNLTECELENASPFRICTDCIKEYTITHHLYGEFIVSMYSYSQAFFCSHLKLLA